MGFHLWANKVEDSDRHGFVSVGPGLWFVSPGVACLVHLRYPW